MTVRTIVGPTILLRSGNYFDFLAPETSKFTIEDIAHGLSNICRFNGHCRHFYSVAQHCVLMSQVISKQHAYAALMHDATEAFVGDMTRPLKEIVPGFREIEGRVERAIFDRFKVPCPCPDEVKEADNRMLATEQLRLMENRDDWDYYTGGKNPYLIDILYWSPSYARSMFLLRYKELRA